MISSIESVHRKRMREGKDRQIIYIWEENGAIAACILPDGENIYVSIKNGYEKLFPSMIGFGERNCRALFGKREDGLVKFWVAINNRFTYMQEALADLGYSKYPEEEYANCVFPMEGVFPVELPEGFRLLYGEAYPDEENKWSALRLGFHPEYEKPGYRAGMNPYIARKSSSLYQDSFERVIVDESTKGVEDAESVENAEGAEDAFFSGQCCFIAAMKGASIASDDWFQWPMLLHRRHGRRKHRLR